MRYPCWRMPGTHRLLRAFLILVASSSFLSLLPVAPFAATSAPSPPADADAEADYARAAVILDGEALFSVSGIQAYPAEKRAAAIGDRLRAVAADRGVPIESLRVIEKPLGSDILAGGRFLMSVLEVDGAREGVAHQLLAQAIRQRIAEAIAAYRAERTLGALLLKTAYALGVTLVSCLLVLAVHRGFRLAGGFVERRAQGRMAGLEAQSFRLIQARQLTAGLRGLILSIKILAFASIAYGFLQLVLGLFPQSRPLARRLTVIIIDPLASMGAAILDAVPNLVFLAILIVVIRYVLKLVRLFFAGVQSGTITLTNFDADWAWPTYRILRFLVIAFGVVVAYPYIPGSESRAFQGISIFIGIIFSLGSSSFIANLIAGYSLTYRRTFHLGDRIRIGDVTGDVAEIGLMVTRLRTVKNEEVVVPNATVLGNNVVNYSTLAKSHGLILHTTAGIGYETPWRQVEAMLTLAADRTPGLLKEPAPFVLQKALGDFCVTYEINVYCDTPQTMARLYTELHRNILDVFNEYGVQIMTPAYERDPDQPKVVPREQWFLAPAEPPKQQIEEGRDPAPPERR
jgi:small-conductance mechanosensitive channel